MKRFLRTPFSLEHNSSIFILFLIMKSRFTVVLMKRCPKATKYPYNKLQPSYPHEATCLAAETFMHGPFKIGHVKNHLGGAYLHFILSPKLVRTSAFYQISRNCCCLQNTTSGSQCIASYWPFRVCRSIKHISMTNSTALGLAFWNTHLHLCFHNIQTAK